jgi:hypothetical protein
VRVGSRDLVAPEADELALLTWSRKLIFNALDSLHC